MPSFPEGILLGVNVVVSFLLSLNGQRPSDPRVSPRYFVVKINHGYATSVRNRPPGHVSC